MYRAQTLPSYKIKVMPRGRMSISKCQKFKITFFGHNFVMHSFRFSYDFATILTLLENYVAHSKRNCIFQVKVNDQRKFNVCFFGP